ncbi:MAG: winged helix-turn-helix domain-containing protein [Pseudomonadota bacterium]
MSGVHGEGPFQLGRWRVEPRELRLVGAEETRTLEPRVMAVLVALARTPGQVVTKDELVADAWGGAPVTDNAITWAVSRLRKALSPETPIRTVTGQGYRLEIELRPIDGAVRVARRRWPLVVSVAAAVAVAILLLGSEREPDRDPAAAIPTLSTERRLTTLPGRETEPALSADGRWLAFSHRATPADRWELRIVATTEERLLPVTGERGEQTGELRASARSAVPIRIEQPESSNRAAAWSPSGLQLAYFAYGPGACSLRRMQLDEDFDVIEDAVVTACEAATSGRVAWLSESVLLATLSTAGRHALHRIDLADGRIEAISDPGEQLPGDRIFGLAPARDRVALVRHRTSRESELFVGPPDGSAWERLGATPYWFHAVTIDAADRLRFNATDQELVIYDSDLGAPRTLLRYPERVWGLTAGLNDAVAFESFPRTRARIIARYPGGGERPIARSAGTERSPAVADDGTLAWVSNRTGFEQIWLRAPGGEDSQLSDARRGQRFGQLRWSPHGTRILAVADGAIGSLGLEGQAFAIHSLPNDVVRDPSWTPDGLEVRFSLRTGDTWTWMTVAIDQLPETRRVVLDDAISARALSDGRIVHFRGKRDGLWVTEADGTRRRIADAALPDHWALDGPTALLVSERRLQRVDLTDGSVTEGFQLGPLDGTELAFDPSTGSWLVTRYDNPESDIVIASPRR